MTSEWMVRKPEVMAYMLMKRAYRKPTPHVREPAFSQVTGRIHKSYKLYKSEQYVPSTAPTLQG